MKIGDHLADLVIAQLRGESRHFAIGNAALDDLPHLRVGKAGEERFRKKAWPASAAQVGAMTALAGIGVGLGARKRRRLLCRRGAAYQDENKGEENLSTFHRPSP